MKGYENVYDCNLYFMFKTGKINLINLIYSFFYKNVVSV